MVDWPSTLPDDPRMDSFRRRPFREPITSKPEDGPVIKRNRSLTEIISQRIELRMTETQLAAFWTFWRADLSFGVQRFNMSVLITGRTRATRVCWIEGVPEDRPHGTGWVVTFDLNVLFLGA
jgi:hypothetical protein